MSAAGSRTSSLKAIPAGIWALGFVSLLMDVSSEMIHALLPVYLVTAMGASMATVGLIEGVAEAIAHIVKVFSGALSDWLGRRKLLAAIGYGLAAFTKPVFPLAPSIGWLVAARFIDRVGKGIRGAPRDALVADLAPPHLRGASFGLRQMLDTIGAFLGPLAAILLMWLLADDFRSVFWVAVIPAFLSLALIVFVVREPARAPGLRKVRAPLSIGELKRLGADYWAVVVVSMLFALARFSEAFLILRAEGAGLMLVLVPVTLVVMNIAYALSAYPAGALSDRVNRMSVLLVGLALLVAADIVLAFSGGVMGILIGVALWGVHMGFTQGLFAALVADTAPAELRGTGFGAYNLMSGLMTLVASVLAGALWDAHGPAATFLAGAGFAALCAIGVVALRPRFAADRRNGGSPN
ncbi:MAG TPA: MFS transporter [Devosiaceae bacterium]